jgi:RNA polymerase sporulation-specific sigma factor
MSGTASAELLRAAQAGDSEACEQAIRENNGLIWSIVRRYSGRGVETDDLYQLGCVGLLKAIRGFDFSFGTCFSTYAVPKIAGEIRRFLRDDGTVKVSRSIREQAQSLYIFRTQLQREFGREPTLSELADVSGLTVEEIAQAEMASVAPESLQAENEDGLALEGVLGTEAPEDQFVEQIALRQAIDALPPKERMTILLRYFRGLTQEQTAKILKVSQVQISRLERRGLAALKESYFL